MKDVLLIDFNDSFTYNIVAELHALGLTCEIITWNKSKKSLVNLINSKKKKILLLGPGPGHPSEYSDIFYLIKKAMSCEHIFHMGICLGHQIYWKLQGVDTLRRSDAIHGVAVPFTIPSWDLFSEKSHGKVIMVQKYNSLYLNKQVLMEVEDESNFVFLDEECLLSRFGRGISYQFHPESVGTSYPKELLNCAQKFLYNEVDDISNENRWHLRSKDDSNFNRVESSRPSV
jgi:anthranilate/para-aminobenzoate synthase component II